MKKFEFGKNWEDFIARISKKNILLSKKHIINFTKINNFKNKSFIDIGSGSGLSSLAAIKLNANVLSIDVDLNSVKCTKFLKQNYFKNSKNWKIEKLSILNSQKIKKLNKFDIVYSWGVLHHTGNLRKALINTEALCKKNGLIYLAIYNDQGKKSKFWKEIKKLYVNSNFFIKKILIFYFSLFFTVKPFIKSIINKNLKLRNRGMDHKADLIDWIGGYPFEVAKPEEIINFFLKKNYKLINLKTCGGGHGNNEFLFKNEKK